jgi:DNA-binding IclR family transcriptional regulator
LSVPAAPQRPAAARAIVEHLRQRVRWGVHLAPYQTGRLVVIDGDPDHPLLDEMLLARHPHASALGKLLLADQADRRTAVRGLRQLTANTIIDAGHLDAELERCRQDRLARQCGELHPDRGCLAVPIHDVADGTLIAGLALSGPPDRVAGPNTELLERLREHANQLAPLLA